VLGRIPELADALAAEGLRQLVVDVEALALERLLGRVDDPSLVQTLIRRMSPETTSRLSWSSTSRFGSAVSPRLSSLRIGSK